MVTIEIEIEIYLPLIAKLTIRWNTASPRTRVVNAGKSKIMNSEEDGLNIR